MTSEQPWSLRVTAENLAALLGALPKSIANTIKRMALADWRKTSGDASGETDDSVAGALPTGCMLIYESKDGKLCLYQDRNGHLIAADSEKFV